MQNPINHFIKKHFLLISCSYVHFLKSYAQKKKTIKKFVPLILNASVFIWIRKFETTTSITLRNKTMLRVINSVPALDYDRALQKNVQLYFSLLFCSVCFIMDPICFLFHGLKLWINLQFEGKPSSCLDIVRKNKFF